MTRPDPAVLLADLCQEGDLLEETLRPLSAEDWDRPTPAEGWTIRHQVAHLSWTERTVLTALEEPEVFAQLRERFGAEADVVDRAAAEGATRAPAKILGSWQDSRRRVLERLAAVPEGKRIPWIGPPMGAPMMASARIMETFAHGQDVRDALEVPPVASHRLRHVAHLGVATRDYAFWQRRLEPPAEPFRVELMHEDETWTWGPTEAVQRVHGPALDFALLATRRRHRQDGSLVAEGADADAWLDIVQSLRRPTGSGASPADVDRTRSGRRFGQEHPWGAAPVQQWSGYRAPVPYRTRVFVVVTTERLPALPRHAPTTRRPAGRTQRRRPVPCGAHGRATTLTDPVFSSCHSRYRASLASSASEE